MTRVQEYSEISEFFVCTVKESRNENSHESTFHTPSLPLMCVKPANGRKLFSGSCEDVKELMLSRL